MSPPRLLRFAASVRSAPLAIAACAAVALSGCGDPSVAVAPAPTTSPSTGFVCPLPTASVAFAIHSDAKLVRKQGTTCQYGSEDSAGRASDGAPVAWLERKDGLAIATVRARVQLGPDVKITDRPDLAPGAFAVERAGEQGRRRATLVFPHRGQVWAVTVEVARSAYARNDARDWAEGLFDTLTSPAQPTSL